MKGSTIKRCSCPTEYDSKGRRKACPKRHGSWSYIIDVGFVTDPATGKRKRKQLRKSGFKTQTEAAAAMAEVLGEVDQGRYRHDGRQTVEGWCEIWLERKALDYRPTTMANARRWLRRVYPYIGHLRLRDLQAAHISEMNRTITAEGAKAKKRVGPTTTRRIHNTLSSALSDARKEGLIRHNPAFDAWQPAEPKTKVDPWDGDELGKFLDYALEHHALGSVFELMAMGALRRGEALGARWSDIDMARGVLVVRQQLVAVEFEEGEEQPQCPYCGAIHKGLIFGPPKTANGEARKVYLGQAAVGALMAHRLQQETERAAMGEAYVEHDLVFADVDGNPRQPNYVTKTIRKIAAAAGVREQKLHALRHGRASLMLAAGADMTMVSKMLGHSSVRITSDTYSHLLEGVGNQAADQADSLIVRGSRDQSVTNPGGETVEAPFGDHRKEPLTCENLGGAEGIRTPDPLHAMQIRPLSDGDGE